GLVLEHVGVARCRVAIVDADAERFAEQRQESRRAVFGPRLESGGGQGRFRRGLPPSPGDRSASHRQNEREHVEETTHAAWSEEHATTKGKERFRWLAREGSGHAMALRNPRATGCLLPG